MNYRYVSRRSATASILTAISAAKLAIAEPKPDGVRDGKGLPRNVQSFIDGFASKTIVGLTVAVNGPTSNWTGGAGYSNLQTMTPTHGRVGATSRKLSCQRHERS
jgi:hypothetical protein